MSSGDIYCSECKHRGRGEDIVCKHPSNRDYDSPYSRDSYTQVWSPFTKNGNNDCDLFEYKKPSIWEKLF